MYRGISSHIYIYLRGFQKNIALASSPLPVYTHTPRGVCVCVCVCVCVSFFLKNAPQHRNPRSEGIFSPAATPQNPAATPQRAVLDPRLAHTRELCFLKLPRNPAAPGQRAFLTPQQPRRTPQNPAAALRCQRLLAYLAHSRHIWLQAQTANRPIRCRIGGCGDHHRGASRATSDRDRPQSP